jgi:hypothetical protein
MTQHRLGKTQQAQASLARLRQAVRLPQGAEAHAFLAEAEALIAARPTAVRD